MKSADDLCLVSNDELINELKRRSDTFFYSFYFADRQQGSVNSEPIIRYDNKFGIGVSGKELSEDLVGNMIAGLQFIKKSD